MPQRAVAALLLLLVAAGAVVWALLTIADAKDAARLHEQALEFDRNGETRLAEEAFAAAERKGRDTPEFWTDYGHVRMRNGGALAAEPLFRRALERRRAHAPAHLGLAEVYLRLERPGAAGQEYAIAAEGLPARAHELLVNAGMAYLGAGQRDRARALFRKALAAKPGYEPAEEGLAQTEAGAEAR